MAKLVLGRQVIDSGPCTDAQPNFAELAGVLEALGNPAPDPGPGPIDPVTGDPVDQGDPVTPVYVNEDGDLITVEDGDTTVIGGTGGGSGTDADLKTFYNLVWGTNTTPDAIDGDSSFFMVVAGVEDAISAHVPKDTVPNPSPTPSPVVGTQIEVDNNPRVRTVRGDVVYARYNHATGRWTTDSLFNATAWLRGRAGWEKDESQVIYHGYTSNSIEWEHASGLVVLGVTQSPVGTGMDTFDIGVSRKISGMWGMAELRQRPTTVTVNNTFDWAIDGNSNVLAAYNDEGKVWEAVQAKCPIG